MTALFGMSGLEIPWTVTLGCACAFSYLVGRITFGEPRREDDATDMAIFRVGGSSDDLQEMAEYIDRNLAAYRASVKHSKDILAELEDAPDGDRRADLTHEARVALDNSLRLAGDLAETNEAFRRRLSSAPTVVANQTQTGLQNREELDASLARMFAVQARYELPFCVVAIGTCHRQGEPQASLSSRELDGLAELLDRTARDTDVVARYGAESFVVLLPNTPARSAMQFADRVRQEATGSLDREMCVGVALAAATDGPQSLLTRTMRALEQAKTSDVAAVHFHDGHKAVAVQHDYTLRV